MAKLKENFGQRLKALREAKGITQEALGRQVKVDYKHIVAIERGIRAPSFELIERLSATLKCHAFQFFLAPEHQKINLASEIEEILALQSIRRRKTITKLLEDVARAAKKLESA